jgi:pimeloyl-ACP methyl ester carboxylesterase
MKCKNTICFVLMMLCSLINMQAQLLPKYSTEEIEVNSNGLTLFGSLLVPNYIQNPPIVLIIAGSGPTDRNGNNPLAGENNSLKMLAEGLANKGIASIRYDKRGIGKSLDEKLDENTLRFETYINDARKFANFAKIDTRFSKLFIAGHSEGSLIGMVAAKYVNANGFISIAGMGRPFDEVIKEQLLGQPEYVIKKANEILDSLKIGVLVYDAPTYLNALFRTSVQPYLISMFAYSPEKIISELEMPCLILQGKNDLQVKVKDAENLSKAQPNAKMVVFEKMNHVLKDCNEDKESNLATYSNPTLLLSNNLINEIVNFVNKVK